MRERIDRYQIKDVVGQGGMATVYYAYDPRVKRDVAVKLLLSQLTADPEFRQRFEREAAIIAALDHPAIVPVYDYGEDQGQPFIVMRYMAGGSLDGLLRERGALPLAEAAVIVERIAAALDQAHAQGLVHRDLKPGNILFDQYGEAYLSDFGIARMAESGSSGQLDDLFGTPAYVSPEQVAGAKLDARSDVYSLAVVFFTLLAGRPPFEAESPTALALKHISEPTPDLSALRSDLPAGIQTVVERGMAKDRDERYSTAGELAEELLRASEQHVAAPKRRTPSSARIRRDQVQARLRAESKKPKGDPTQAAVPLPATPGSTPRPPHQPPPLRKSRLPQRGVPGWVFPAAGVAVLAAAIILFALLRGRDSAAIGLTGSATSAPSLTQIAEMTGLAPTGMSGPILPLGGTDQQTGSPGAETGVPERATGEVTTATPPPTATDPPPTATPTSTASPTAAPTLTETPIPPTFTSVPAGATAQPRILFAAGDELTGATNLFAMLPDGSDLLQITFDSNNNRTPDWSPDASQIVFRTGRTGARAIAVMAADGSAAPVLLTDPADDSYWPSWSEDAQHIAFVSERDGNPEIYVMDADGSNEHRVTNSWANDLGPVWAPDASRLAYFSNVTVEGGQDIYTMNLDGTARTRITSDPAFDYMPAWSPDGSRLAFVSERDGNPEIYVMNADGSGQTRLTNHTAADLYPTWSPDGVWVLFASRRNGNMELYMIRADGAELRRISFTNHAELDPQWGP